VEHEFYGVSGGGMSLFQKTPLSRTLPQFVNAAAIDQIVASGQGYPGQVTAVNGAIVTVNFLIANIDTPDGVQMPVASPEYVRWPIQKNDLGVAVPMSVYIGCVSGLGGANTNYPVGNLAALVWMPTGNVNFAVVDPNALTLYGPNGVVVRDSGSSSAMTLTPPHVVFQTASVSVSGNLSAGNGWNGTFTTPTGQTVTVQDGIIINVD
jgi:hypothetical protein